MNHRFVSEALTHRGAVRPHNEDAFVDRSDIGLWAVADGAGGQSDGQIASAAIAEALASMPEGLSAAELLAQVRLRVAAVHADLQERVANGPEDQIIASTAVVLMARGEHIACLWAGDSRAYLLREDKLTRLTRDHSVVQELVEAGLLAPDQMESHSQAAIITRAVGAEGPLELDKVSATIVAGDVLLLCSDGLFKAIDEPELEHILAAGAGPKELMEIALAHGARDNVTVLIVRKRDDEG